MALLVLLSPLIVFVVGDLSALTGLLSLDALGVLAPIRDAITQLLSGIGLTIV